MPYTVLHTEFDYNTKPGALRQRLDELQVHGAVFCDPHRPCLYAMVPPGTDQHWPRALARAEIDCLGGTQPYIWHVGVPRIDITRPPGPYWLLPPDSVGRRHTDPEHLYEALHACVPALPVPGQDPPVPRVIK
ncbi:hypothetical protein ACH4NF_34370 [Streptomyces sp. NPDC017248]|uniref:hypothetical protein n=1 Tax=unclassified Streptomyces TaxID=2593676 RepID=UPI00378F0518